MKLSFGRRVAAAVLAAVLGAAGGATSAQAVPERVDPSVRLLPAVTPSTQVWRWCTKTTACPNGIVGGPSETIARKTLPAHATSTKVFLANVPATLGAVPGGYRDAAQVTPTANGETFVVNGDGRVYHQYIVSGAGTSAVLSGWGPMDLTPSPIWGNVSVGINDLGNQELYVRGTDGNVYHNYATPGRGSGWSGWWTMGTAAAGIVGDIHVGRNSLGNQELYVVGTDGQIWHNFATPGKGSGWYGWTPMGRPTTVRGDVQLMLNDLGNQELYVAGADGLVYHTYATPGTGSGWSGWSSLGTGAGTSFADGVYVSYFRVTSDPFPYDRQILFAVGNDNQVWANVANPGTGSGWTGWFGSGYVRDTAGTVQTITDGYLETSDITTTKVYARAGGSPYVNTVTVDTTNFTVTFAGWKRSV